MHHKGTLTIPEYIRTFKGICDELPVIKKPVNDHEKVFKLLNRLKPGYKSFVMTIIKLPIPFYTDIVPLLQSHELL